MYTLTRASRRAFATHASATAKDCSTITPPYPKLLQKLETVRDVLGRDRKLTLAEKILYAHLHEPHVDLERGKKIRGEAYLRLKPQRVAMQDASAQMALLQFMTCGLPKTAVPTSIHCDHLIQALEGAEADLQRSIVTNQEVFDFLESAAKKYGIEFWRPGSGIIHQIVLENYAAPGMLMLGTDSHTPNAGGLGTVAIGVGGADAVDAMTDTPWELRAPLVTGIHLTGKMGGWTTPKDLILHLAGKLTVRGGTGRIWNTLDLSGYLAADEGAEYDEVIEIDLSKLEPTINGPFTPDLATPLSQFGNFVKKNGWKDELSAGLIGSCTNSSYEDMSRVASIARQAKQAGLKSAVPFLCTPGSEQIRATIERDGLTESLQGIGATVLANACGPCIGQWKPILTSFNRNFKARNDANSLTMNFLASPEVVTAISISGKLSFNPMTDTLATPNGGTFRFSPPSGDTLPAEGFTPGNLAYTPKPNPEPQPETEVVIKEDSSRLQVLKPFGSPFAEGGEKELKGMECLMRVRGKCTTDHISAAGPWLKYKGHLENISENLLITAVNDEGGEVNVAFDWSHKPGDSSHQDTIPAVAKRFKARNQPWCLVVDENYGEGSAREHAALQPRFYGCSMIVARSFARIHETNLKKQGVLPLWFADKADYGKIKSGDHIETVGLANVVSGESGAQIKLRVTPRDGGAPFDVTTRHTMSVDQLKWLQAGSALNYIRDSRAAA
ncbi:aconitate hydratase [Ceratobasidium sp. AG-Ba]|nr:aconitate hydratase [Ceratobasidium sp. AG-Ba]